MFIGLILPTTHSSRTPLNRAQPPNRLSWRGKYTFLDVVPQTFPAIWSGRGGFLWLELRTARAWGLYVSTSRGKTSTGVVEPDLFSEPVLYLVRPDSTLYFGAVQTMPFARPHFDDVVKAVKFALDKYCPARGEVTSLPEKVLA